jgi:hypothetical protein
MYSQTQLIESKLSTATVIQECMCVVSALCLALTMKSTMTLCPDLRDIASITAQAEAAWCWMQSVLNETLDSHEYAAIAIRFDLTYYSLTMSPLRSLQCSRLFSIGLLISIWKEYKAGRLPQSPHCFHIEIYICKNWRESVPSALFFIHNYPME